MKARLKKKVIDTINKILGACRELAPSKQESTTYEPSLVCKLLILGCRPLIPDRLLEMELAGAIHYTHYSFMVFGYNRIPIVSWLGTQADESLAHARAAGELVTQLGAHPSLAIGPLLETQKHDIGDILRESLGHEQATLKHYESLLELGACRE